MTATTRSSTSTPGLHGQIQFGWKSSEPAQDRRLHGGQHQTERGSRGSAKERGQQGFAKQHPADLTSGDAAEPEDRQVAAALVDGEGEGRADDEDGQEGTEHHRHPGQRARAAGRLRERLGLRGTRSGRGRGVLDAEDDGHARMDDRHSGGHREHGADEELPAVDEGASGEADHRTVSRSARVEAIWFAVAPLRVVMSLPSRRNATWSARAAA